MARRRSAKRSTSGGTNPLLLLGLGAASLGGLLWFAGFSKPSPGPGPGPGPVGPTGTTRLISPSVTSVTASVGDAVVLQGAVPFAAEDDHPTNPMPDAARPPRVLRRVSDRQYVVETTGRSRVLWADGRTTDVIV